MTGFKARSHKRRNVYQGPADGQRFVVQELIGRGGPSPLTVVLTPIVTVI
jgi:hypothetical protein